MEKEILARRIAAPTCGNLKEELGPLLTESQLGAAGSRHRSTPPATPPNSLNLPASEGVTKTVSPNSLGRVPAIAAPTTAVDDIAERFGRRRAHSLSRHDFNMFLPAWQEEDTEGAAPYSAGKPPSFSEDRRRTMSMSFAESRRRPNRERCLDCNLPPSFAHEGETAIFCRAHQMEGMVDVLRKGCRYKGCHRTASYGFPGEGRERCFSHMEDGMVHVLTAAKPAKGAAAEIESEP